MSNQEKASQDKKVIPDNSDSGEVASTPVSEPESADSLPPHCEPYKRLTMEEYKKLPTRIKRRLGNLKPPLDSTKPTPENRAIYLRDVVNLYDRLARCVYYFPKVEKTSCGLATIITYDLNDILLMAHRAEQYNPAIDRENLFREIAARLACLDDKLHLTTRVPYMDNRRRDPIIALICDLQTRAIGLAMGHHNIKAYNEKRQHKADDIKCDDAS